MMPKHSSTILFVFEKHIEELADAQTHADSLVYNCKMFVKDYHNIRGKGVEVADSRSIPLKRTAFKLNTS